MYVMMSLMFGSLLVGFFAPLPGRAQTLLALGAAAIATLIYFVFQRAM